MTRKINGKQEPIPRRYPPTPVARILTQDLVVAAPAPAPRGGAVIPGIALAGGVRGGGLLASGVRHLEGDIEEIQTTRLHE